MLDQEDLDIVLLSFICILHHRPQCRQEIQQLLQPPFLPYRTLGSQAENRGQRALYVESKQIQNWRNKQEGGIWNMWALWECQIGRTKANCDGWKVWNCPSLFGKDWSVMTKFIFPQSLGKALWAHFSDRPFNVHAESGKTCWCEWTCSLNSD